LLPQGISDLEPNAAKYSLLPFAPVILAFPLFSLAQIHQANLSSLPNNSAGQNPEKQFYPSLLTNFFLRCLRSYSVPQNAQTAIAHGSFVLPNPIRQKFSQKYVRSHQSQKGIVKVPFTKRHSQSAQNA
jgi:hypothetical protein